MFSPISFLKSLVFRIGRPSLPSFDDGAVITLLHTNDLHGIVKHQNQGGLARIATYVRQVRTEMPNVILLDGGDTVHGTAEQYVTRGLSIVAAMNTMDYDAAVVGNHELDYGTSAMRRLLAEINFPMLAANLFAQSGGSWDRVRPYVILERGGFRVAVIGITTLEVMTLHWPAFVAEILVEDPIKMAAKLTQTLRSQADVVIVLSHLGLKEDVRLAESVDGIDFIIGAHSHSLVSDWKRINNTVIAQAGGGARFLGRLDFIVGRQPDQSVRVLSINGVDVLWSDCRNPPLGLSYPRSPLILLPPTVPQDAAVLRALQPFEIQTQRELGREIGAALQDIPGGEFESAASNLVADAIRAFSGSDIALVDIGSLNLKGLTKGIVTVGAAHAMIGGYTRQELIVAEISIGDLVQAMEENFALMKVRSLGISGATMEWGNDERVLAIRINGKPANYGRVCSVAAQSYVMMRLMRCSSNVRVVAQFTSTTREAIVNYIKREAVVNCIKQQKQVSAQSTLRMQFHA